MKLFKLWAPVVIWASIIFYFSGIPDLKTGLEYDFFLRKAAHVTEYLILTFLLYRAFRGAFNPKFALKAPYRRKRIHKKVQCKFCRRPPLAGLTPPAATSCGVAARRADFAIAKSGFNMHTFGLLIYPGVFSFVYAVSDEIHQYFVLGRSCSARDVLIDSIGIASFYIFIKIKKGYLCLTR